MSTDAAGHAFVAGSTTSPPYSADLILFALDASTGVEFDRGVVASGPSVLAEAFTMKLDARQDIFIGSDFTNADTSAVSMTVVKYDSMEGDTADVNGDGVVDIADLLALLAAWGPCGGCAADVDGDGSVGIADLLALLASWG